MTRALLIIAVLVSNIAVAQNQCADWQRTPSFKSKADCEEVVKIREAWDTLCSDAEKKAGLWPENLSAADRSAYDLCQVNDAKETADTVLSSHKNDPKVQDFWKTLRSDVLSHWADTKDIFCMFHPSALYLVEGDHMGAHCPADDQYGGVPDKKAMDKLFDEDEALSANVMTFSASQRCHDIKDSDGQKACLQKQVDEYKPLLDAVKSQRK